MGGGGGSSGSARERFAALAARPDAEIDAALGALLIAAEERPELDVERCRAALAALAERAATALAGLRGIGARAAALARFLHDEVGLRGNATDYYDPRNSDLGAVLERGLGIPITLAIVYVDVARRLGLRADGVGFPGHFLASVATEEGAQVLVDAFSGRVLDLAACEALLARAVGAGARIDPALLAPASPREILARVLRNLKQIHLQRGAHGGGLESRPTRSEPQASEVDALAAALAASERILLLYPTNVGERRDAAALASRLALMKRRLN